MQTVSDENILKIAQMISAETTKNRIKQILCIICKIPFKRYPRKKWLSIFLKRSGTQIFKENFCVGCSDYAVAFLTLCRACNIGCRLIHGFDKEWLANGSLNSIQGHFFAEYFEKDSSRWILVDPTQGCILCSWPEQYVLHAVSADIWSMDLRDYEDMFKQAKEFQLQWREKEL